MMPDMEKCRHQERVWQTAISFLDLTHPMPKGRYGQKASADQFITFITFT